jgi:hypothetical protein
MGCARALSAVCVTGCLAAGLGCQNFNDPPVTFVVGLRVLGVKAEPPEVPVGGNTMLNTLAVDTTGAAIAAAWSECLVPPLAGTAVNPACVGADASVRQPIGQGLMLTVTMPPVAAGALGSPDQTGGVYLPLVAEVSAETSALTTVYRLRLAGAAPANANPTIATVFQLDASGAMVPLDPSAATPVPSGGSVSLGVTFTPGSAQTYTAADGTATVETLTTSWFCTAGDLSVEKTADTQPLTVLNLNQRLPAPGSQIDLWAVARDERGGTDFTHRTLQLR